MATIQFPTKNSVKYFDDDTVYLRADTATLTQYCIDEGYTFDSFIPEKQRFSNDGSLGYMYYGVNPKITGVTAWYMEFGFSQITQTLTTT